MGFDKLDLMKYLLIYCVIKSVVCEQQTNNINQVITLDSQIVSTYLIYSGVVYRTGHTV